MPRGVPVTINMGFGIRSRPTTPLVPIPRLKALGVRRISLPRMLPAASIRAMETALQLMRQSVETGVPVDRPDLLAGIEDIMKLMGYDAMRDARSAARGSAARGGFWRCGDSPIAWHLSPVPPEASDAPSRCDSPRKVRASACSIACRWQRCRPKSKPRTRRRFR